MKTPLNDRTNLPLPSSSSPAVASSSRPKPTSTPSWRQTSLSFLAPPPRPSASALSTPPAPSSPLRRSASDASSSRLVDEAGRFGDEDGEGDCTMDGLDDDGETGAEEPSERARGKRRRVEVDDEEEEEEVDEAVAFLRPSGGNERVPSRFNEAGKQMSVFEAMKRRELGFRAGGNQLSMRPWLQTMVSSDEEDVTRLPSARMERNFAPPFALAFSYSAKQGGKKVAAVADEEGMISFLSAEKDKWTRGPTKHSFQAHDNAMFDVKWSDDDQYLATASGDQTVRVWDVRTQACVAVMAGHTCTVKNVSFDPHNPHMLSTASRDGSIRVWDRRVEAKHTDEAGELGVATVNQIKNAHGVKGKGAKGRSATRSVTSVTYLAHQPNLLASSGSYNSTVKIWDLRRSHSRRVNPDSYETNEDALLDIEAASGTARPHGIASMSLAPDGRRLYALSTNSQIYAFTPLNLTLPSPVQVYTSPLARFSSFYNRCAVSPCSRYLAAGSSDGGVLMWDVEGDGTGAVRVGGHEKEVSGLDWCEGGLATCSDDLLVRYWQPNPRISTLRTVGTTSEKKNPLLAVAGEDDGRAFEGMKARERWSGEAVEEAKVAV